MIITIKLTKIIILMIILILKKIIQLIITTITFGLTEMKIFGDWLITSFL